MNPYYNQQLQPTQNFHNPQLESQINRLNYLQQNYNQQYQPQQNFNQPVQQQAPQMPQIRPVTSLAEITAITPNFDGSKLYFEDVTNGKLYVKYLGMNGLPITDVFGKEEITQNEEKNDFISRKEFNELNNKVAKYESIFNELMGGNNSESNANA